MEKGKETSYFLGANTYRGFYSLYDHYINTQDGDFLWVVKGGPGCGKSSFMRHIGKAAQRAGLDVEYIYCSGDPKSLDGVYIPGLRVAYVDGTAPHIIEPPYPGAGGAYLDLSKYYDIAGMQTVLPVLTDLNRQYKEQYRHAYEMLAAAAALEPAKVSGLLTEHDICAVRHRAASAIHREMKPRHRQGRVQKRFISAFSCEGRLLQAQTVTALCKKVYLLDHSLGLSDTYLQEVAHAAEQRGYFAVCCPNPLRPEQLEAVLLPELSLGFAATEIEARFEGISARHIRLDAIPDEKRIRALRPQLRACSKLRNQLLDQAETSLAQAKALHDLLEQTCNPYVDFEGVYREADEHIRILLG